MQNCVWRQHTPVNLSSGMSDIRPTFAAFSMSPETITECLWRRTPKLQKQGGKLHRRFVLKMYCWLTTPRRFAKHNHMSLIRTTGAEFGRQSVFALSSQLELYQQNAAGQLGHAIAHRLSLQGIHPWLWICSSKMIYQNILLCNEVSTAGSKLLLQAGRLSVHTLYA